jgi:hypothetical protein
VVEGVVCDGARGAARVEACSAQRGEACVNDRLTSAGASMVPPDAGFTRSRTVLLLLMRLSRRGNEQFPLERG